MNLEKWMSLDGSWVSIGKQFAHLGAPVERRANGTKKLIQQMSTLDQSQTTILFWAVTA